VITASLQLPDATAEQQLVERILASKHFSKAPLLSAFLAYVCDRRDGGAARISEQEIGVAVFGRQPGYDSREDNIVRNYARQLRKRLEEYYATEGQDEQLNIAIPKGGYIPVFSQNQRLPAESDLQDLEGANQNSPRPDLATPGAPSEASGRNQALLAALVFSVVLCALLFRKLEHRKDASPDARTSQPLWKELFFPNKDTFLVPSDSAFVTLQDMEGRTYSLAEYTSWPAVEQPQSTFISGLKTRKYTAMSDLETIARLERLPEAIPNHCLIRAVRDLTLEDLKNGNLILLGSIYSIPWIELLQNNLNFHFIYKPSQHRAWIENQHPAQGEAPVYASTWNGPAEKAYAVIALVPNLNHSGHILLIQGLDGTGTEAADSLLFRAGGMDEIVEKARRPDGTLGSFEALLESTSVDSHPTSVRILAIRTSRQ
jgi:hypothetical protein